MPTSNVIVIGAGAAGLQACCRLAEAGYRVTLLEAAPEAGGRIRPLTPAGFSVPVEGGAEFIHGKLPFSLRLTEAAGVPLEPVRADMVRWTSGKGWGGDDGEGGVSGEDWEALMEAMAGLETDMAVSDFLEVHFTGNRWADLREAVGRFAEGYDLADLDRVSTLALYKEWSEEGQEEYRPVGGYGPMIDFLVAECRRQGAELHFSVTATGISWEKDRVTVRTEGGQVFEANQLVVSVSLGMLRAGTLGFDPLLPDADEAIRRLGYGSVVKILLEFGEPFWLKKKSKGGTLFILSDQPVPTWWTQNEDDHPVLTGWLAGQRMRHFLTLTAEEQLELCLKSLGAIFSLDVAWLRKQLRAFLILDWANMPFVKGGYSFEAVGAESIRQQMSAGVEGTIWFCGEAFYEGDQAPGTVEAALSSGWNVAEKIIAR